MLFLKTICSYGDLPVRTKGLRPDEFYARPLQPHPGVHLMATLGRDVLNIRSTCPVDLHLFPFTSWMINFVVHIMCMGLPSSNLCDGYPLIEATKFNTKWKIASLQFIFHIRSSISKNVFSPRTIFLNSATGYNRYFITRSSARGKLLSVSYLS